jgi:hypothetical protein
MEPPCLTHSLDVAKMYAGPNGIILRWRTGKPPPGASYSFEWSPDHFHEQEVLIRGRVEGAGVTIRIAPEDLRRLAGLSKGPSQEGLVAALNSLPHEIMATKTIRARELLPTYRVRLDRWQHEGVPPSIGLPEFVRVLEELGDSEVVITGYQGPDRYYVLLLSAGVDVLLGCIAIEQQSWGRQRDRGPARSCRRSGLGSEDRLVGVATLPLLDSKAVKFSSADRMRRCMRKRTFSGKRAAAGSRTYTRSVSHAPRGAPARFQLVLM